MLRKLLIIAALVAAPAFSADLRSAADAHTDVEASCQEGCVVLSKKEVLALQAYVEQEMKAAFHEGAKQGFDLAKDNPKVCPKNI